MHYKKNMLMVSLFFIVLIAVCFMPCTAHAVMSTPDSTLTLRQDTPGRAVTDDGTYLYVVIQSSPTKVVKVRKSDMKEIGSLTLAVGEDGGFCITNNGTNLYLATDTSPAKVIKVQMSDMTRVNALTLATGEDKVESITNDDTYLYAVTNTSPTKVIKVQMSDMTQAGTTLTLTGITDGRAVTYSGGYLYVVSYTSPTKVIKVNTSDMTQVGDALTLGLDELNGVAVTNDGTYLYVVNYYSAYVTKVQMSDMTKVDAVELTGLSHAHVVAMDNTYLYVATLTNPIKVIKVQKSDMSLSNSYSVSLGGYGATAVSVDDTYLYMVNYLSPTSVIKVQKSNGALAGALILEENNGTAVTNDNTYLYVVNKTSPTTVTRVLKSNKTRVDTLTLNPGENNGTAVTSDGDYLYVVNNTFPTTVTRVQKSNMTRVDTLTLNPGENNGTAVTSDGTYLYVVNNTSPTTVTRVQKSNMTRVDALTLNTEENNGTAVTSDGTYLYVVNNTSPTTVTRVLKSDMTRVDALTLNSGEDNGAAVTNDGTYLYVVNNTSPTKVTRVQMSNMTRVDALTLNSGENNGTAITNDGSYLYVVTSTSPTKVIEVQKSDMTRASVLTLNTGDNNGAAVTCDGTHLYVVNNTSPTKVSVIPYDSTVPAVSSINRYSPTSETTNAASVIYRVTFSEAVTGVDTSDFTLMATGASGTVSSVSAVSDSGGTAIDVTVNSISGSGTLRLDLNSSGTGIADVGGTAIAAGYISGQTYTIDMTAPTISSAARDNNTQITVTLSEACQNLAASNDGGFTVTKTGTSMIYAVSATAQGTDASHVVLTVADMDTAAGTGVTVTYTAGTNGTIADTVGNVLATNSTGVTITAWDTAVPTVSSINRNNPASETTNAASVIYRVTFSEAVTGVDTSDFTLMATGASGTVSSVSAVSDSGGTAIDVTVNSISGSGTLRLDLNSSGTDIADVGGTAIAAGYISGQTYTIDMTAPTISSAARDNNTQITVTLSEACQNLAALNDGGFTVTKTGTSMTYAVSTTAQGTDASHVVLTVADMDTAAGAGVTVTYTAGPSGTISDTAGNALATNSGVAVTAWDTAVPTVSSINRNNPASETTNMSSVTYRVTFSEAVTGVDTTDFTLTATGTVAGTVSSVSDSGGTAIDVTVNSISGDGTLRLDLNSSGTDIADVGGTAIAAGYISGQTYTIDQTAPTLSSAEYDSNTQITVTLSEACQNLEASNDGGFTVTKTGVPGTTFAVSATAAGTGSTVVLTVANMDTVAGTGVTVTYTAGTNGTISDTAGNALATNSTGVTITAWASSGSGGNTSGSSGNNGAAVIVNGKSKTAGNVQTTTNSDGQTVTTVTVDSNKLEDILASESSGATVTVPITGNSDVAAGALTGQTVKNMENKEATLVVQTDSASYALPASEIDIDSVSQQLGMGVSLSDIKVTVSIAEYSSNMTTVVEDASSEGGFAVMAPAVDFTISCKYNGKTVSVDSFNAYVERQIAIPDGVDDSKITTGVLVEKDGSVRHVPTRIIEKDGKYYAIINSLTNSTYAVVYNPVEFNDAANHWAKDAIDDMGSRMIISGVSEGVFEPDRDITRAEFAAIVIRALGLAPGIGENSFSDVASTDWYCGYVETAVSYGIITGYGDGMFCPNDKITREQAMTMIARAMKITGLDVRLTDSDVSKLLDVYSDGSSASAYAKDSIAACLKAGIVSGKGNSTIAPRDYITRAEVAVMVQRLLQKSGLI